jgi:O-antigen ligase
MTMVVGGRPGPVLPLLALACAWAAFMPIGGKYVGYISCGLAALVALQRSGDLPRLSQWPGFQAAAAFYCFALLSVLWSSGGLREIAGQLGLYSLLLLAPVIAAGCPPAFARRVLRHFAAASAVVGGAIALDRHGLLPDSLLWHSTVHAEGNQRIVTSLVLALGASIALVEALRSTAGGRGRWTWVAVAALAVLGLALQDRRTGMVALPVLLAVLGLAHQRQRHPGRALVLLALVAGLSIAAWQWAPGVRGRIDEGVREMLTYQSTDAAATSWGMRLRLAEHTLDMARAAPIAGNGVGSWLVEWRRRVQPGLLISIHTTPHNEYLLVLSQLGAIGIGLLGWLLLGHLWRAWQAGDAGLAALVAWTAITWTGLFNVVLRDAKFALPLLLVAGLAGAVQREASGPVGAQPSGSH